ncbi:LytTR family DNA-binding domain-containing protein [Halosquirtibacter xylanolyticus]|uniref:LytR/AlgR family response regulator transcription factor n=1 Tax=Halosquirtibacter xylanolyticus TaxID=3374599 RepID=UPI00374951E9|nr:LytTR family DNA-binding domain-containing protein [Prolixibacteraceae bacterium]
MRVLIIEDEELLCEELESNLLDIAPDNIEICGKIDTVKDSIAWFKSNTCDLVFMDVHLSDGDCFDIFKEVKVSTPIIFLTAYDQYVQTSFDLNSIAYILKPYDRMCIVKALEKYENLTSYYVERTKENKVEGEYVQEEYIQRMMLRLGRVYKPISVHEICYFIAEDKYLYAITEDGRKFYYDATLKELEEQLDPTLFFRVNRSYMVNKQSVNELVLYSNNRYKLNLSPETDELVLLSATKVLSFKNWLLS